MTRVGQTPTALDVPGNATTVDLTDPRTFQVYDQHEIWRRLRATAPVYRHRGVAGRPGFVVFTRHRDIVEIYRDNQRFTSQHGNVLATLLQGHDSAAGRMLAVTDGERHRDLRNVLVKAFSPRVLTDVSRRVAAFTRDLLCDAVERGSCDFARDVVERIPISTIGDLLGVPPGDHRHLLTLTKSALSSDHADSSHEDAVLARNEILLYFLELIEDIRRSGREGVIDTLLREKVDGRPLSEDDIVFNCYSLIIGGDETSRMAMIGSVPALASRSDQWAALRSGEVGVPSAVEEILRWTTPAMHFGRTAVADTAVNGFPVAEGEIVVMWNSSANRDEEVFAAPGELRLDRSPNRHLTFGYGPHFCLGAHLGRAEVGAMLAALRDFALDFRITAPPERVHSNFLDGISSLQVEFTPDLTAIRDHRRGAAST